MIWILQLPILFMYINQLLWLQISVKWLLELFQEYFFKSFNIATTLAG